MKSKGTEQKQRGRGQRDGAGAGTGWGASSACPLPWSPVLPSLPLSALLCPLSPCPCGPVTVPTPWGGLCACPAASHCQVTGRSTWASRFLGALGKNLIALAVPPPDPSALLPCGPLASASAAPVRALLATLQPRGSPPGAQEVPGPSLPQSHPPYNSSAGTFLPQAFPRGVPSHLSDPPACSAPLTPQLAPPVGLPSPGCPS